MSLQSHIDSLKERHQALDAKVSDEDIGPVRTRTRSCG